MSEKYDEDLDHIKTIDDAWLGLDIPDSQVFNPTCILDPKDVKFHLKMTWLMTKPDYFCFLCHVVLGLDILPVQGLMLKEMWNRKFPMLIASRGFGKSFILSVYSILRALILPKRKVVIVGAAFRQSKVLFDYMETLWSNSPILRSMCDRNSGPRRSNDQHVLRINDSTVTCLPLGDGCLSGDTLLTYNDRIGYIDDVSEKVWGGGKFRDVAYPYNNGVTPTKVVKTHMGFEYESTHNHKMRVCRNGEIVWVRADKIKVGDRILIDRSERWHSGIGNHNHDDYYTLGAMIGDGNYTDKYHLGFATKDQEIVDNMTIPFSQMSDKVHWKVFGKDFVQPWKDKWGLTSSYTKDKVIPEEALKCSKYQMTFLLRGLFDTDGHVIHTEGRGSSTYVGFTNTSKKLVKQIQYILLHYGIVSHVKFRDRSDKWNTVYELLITGEDVLKFKQIGFCVKRKQDLLNKVKSTTFNRDDVPVDKRTVSRISKGSHCKYSPAQILRKKSITSKLLKEISPKLAQKYDVDNTYYDTVTEISDSRSHTYDLNVPEENMYCANGFFSHNTKIRGQRANDIIADEFASIPRDIFETVVAGFGVVRANPIENVKLEAAKAKAKELGIELEDEDFDVSKDKDNQIILSGTAYYDFNHFAQYWKNWCKIIRTKGDRSKLKEIFGGEEPPKDFDWKQYSVIRVPYELLPMGFMDAAQVARSKATVHAGIYQMEYGAVFTRDSMGFFKRSLLESCVANAENNLRDHDDKQIMFQAAIMGNPKKKHIFGVDPASEVDNFSIGIIEVNDDHRKIVYCWTINRSEHREKVKSGETKETDFYAFCARKIRELMHRFPCIHIAMDAGGGGIAVEEALHDKDKLMEGEQPIWQIIEDDVEKDTDGFKGLHILEMCQFAKYEWLREANHGMRKDFEDKLLLFPDYDSVVMGLASIQDEIRGRKYDTLEECVLEIEELKDELAMIELTQTPSGRERWDTPEVVVAAGKKERIRKDRYSAVMMANMAARQLVKPEFVPQVEYFGGFASMDAKVMGSGQLFNGPDWFVEGIKGVY